VITKERFLAGLHELVYVEEGMITVFANFSKVLADQAEDIDQEKREQIKKLLSRLNRDSSRHKEMIDELIYKVGGKSER